MTEYLTCDSDICGWFIPTQPTWPLPSSCPRCDLAPVRVTVGDPSEQGHFRIKVEMECEGDVYARAIEAIRGAREFRDDQEVAAALAQAQS